MGELTYLGEVKRGKPTEYSDALAELICERLADGETLMSICRCETMPNRTTVWRWINQHADFEQRYARARELLADHEADQIRELGDNPFIPPDHKRIMVGTRQWRAERMNNRVWGGKVAHEHKHQVGPSVDEGSLPGTLRFLADHGTGAESGPDEPAGDVGEA